MYSTKKNSWLKHFDFMILDLLCIIVSFVLAIKIRFGDDSASHYSSELYRNILLVMLLLNIILVFFMEPYKNVLKRGRLKELISTIKFVGTNLLGIIFYFYVLKVSNQSSRLMIGYTYAIYFVISYLSRILLKNYIRKKSFHSLFKGDKALLVVTNKKNLSKNVHDISNNNFDMHYIVGICVLDKNMEGQEFEGYPIVANKKNLLDWISTQWVDDVFFGVSINDVPRDIINGLVSAGISIHNVFTDDYTIEGYNQAISKIGPYTVLSSTNKTYTNFQIIIKRLMDIAGGLVGCFVTLILTLIIGPIIYFKSPGPIFYGAERIGLNGRRFKMYKFRSMIPNAEALKKDLQSKNMVKDGMMFKMKDDPRIIPGIGSFIRKTSLDEFPQFFNVLKGDMSLVGTRPPTPDEWNKYKLDHRMRMSIKPGITGLWQISGRSNILDFDEVVRLDKEYIDNFSISLDIKILLKTILYLFSKKDDAM